MNPQEERAARIAALKAQRAAQTKAETVNEEATTHITPSGQSVTATPRRQPTGRAARLITVGASSTAVLGLMTAIGIAEQPVGATLEPVIPVGTAASLSDDIAPGTIRVAADAAVVMVVVDQAGRPVDLRQMSSVAELQEFLATAEPIIAPATTQVGGGTAGLDTTASAAPALNIADSTTDSSSAVTPTPTIAANAPTGTPSQSATEPTTAPVAPAPVATSTPAPTPVVTSAPSAAPPATPAPTVAPTTSVPAAQPVPIEIALPSPTPPPQGNTSGS
ncbi:hypothetical protein N9E02_00635 [Ilumatobacteraceae bacterium]|nr:hypothetical protein [Ilumatobacteraceae bacterium]